MANLKDIWGAGGELDSAGARPGGEKRPLRDFQPPDYDPRQRRRTDEGFAQQQVQALPGVSCGRGAPLAADLCCRVAVRARVCRDAHRYLADPCRARNPGASMQPTRGDCLGVCMGKQFICAACC